ncbi:hypothetical protein [Bradyrhizobium glycinis]|uniref:hypothetical protein n=1 Tax=Bradyrhizobium glycinis TaxID=2751812 RepID=UPI0018D9A149|nr:hypothetical protein [Bradyrhizobium glycinis]MBH5371552.1 hypothetical protein [Bradyrhizobium glycinis]
MTQLADDDDDFVCTQATLKEQVGFCLLGGFGITAEMNHAVYDKVHLAGVFGKRTVLRSAGDRAPAQRTR